MKPKNSDLKFLQITCCILLLIGVLFSEQKNAAANSSNVDFLFEPIGLLEVQGENDGEIATSQRNTFSSELQQQQNIVKGQVTDQGGDPLPGVTIIVEGTTRGVITDNDGTYTIEANPSDKLIISFIGMESQIIEVGNRTIIDITPKVVNNIPQPILSDSRLKLKFGKERMILNDGLQPFMLATRKGTLIVQGHLSIKPFPQERIVYHSALSTVVSRDGAKRWTEFPLEPGDNGPHLEGGIIELRDGTILALDTFVTPAEEPDKGLGLMWYSNDDYRTLKGPVDITFNIPRGDFHGSTDDGGRPHDAMRLHRRILELPNGDLLTTIYGWLKGDNEPVGYISSVKKLRVMLFRSKNRGRHWDMVTTIAVDPKVGTEGFVEPVITRVSKGKHAGRLICMMRTGRELYEAISDDEGITWSKPKPRVFADIDVYRTELWEEMFRGVTRNGVLISENPNEFIGAVVEPDLIELRSGILVAAFGVRIPARACFTNPKHPWNGNYLAFSFDHGETWSHVVRMTTGIPTTHYMAVEELPKDNHLFVVYDFGSWGNKQGRYIYGRNIKLTFDE